MMIIIVIGVVYESLTFHIYRFNISSNLYVKIIFFDRGEAAEGFLLLYFDFGNIRKLPKMAKPGGGKNPESVRGHQETRAAAARSRRTMSMLLNKI